MKEIHPIWAMVAMALAAGLYHGWRVDVTDDGVRLDYSYVVLPKIAYCF